MPVCRWRASYAMERYAFGRPIGSFQAIKHKLADVYVAIELARSNAYYGAWALSADAAELPLAAATARVSATEAFHLASKENIQTHGGIGFTWDVDCHLYLPPVQTARAGGRWRALLEEPAGRTDRNAQRGVGEREPMDFNDTPEEAEFRAEARAFLAANAEPKSRRTAGASSRRHRRRCSAAVQGVAGEEGRCGLRRPSPGRSSSAGARRRRSCR